METTKPGTKILKILLKDFTIKPTITSLAKEIRMSRVGTWKVLKKMQSNKLIVLSPIGSGKTSTYRISLNWDNILVEKTLALSLTEDALKNQRWLNNFTELKEKIDFLMIYGSIISPPQEANDIDILGVVSNKNRFLEIEESVKKIQKTQLKKIHAMNFTQAEFRQELEKPNKAFVDAVKKGVILFGQENFIRFIKSVNRK
ncbi:MAG: hypothetical protein Q8O03_09280 [Nanoarchaeota archaeon]|nr:hypothetical protein [Nanoarchaeota archaeon]